MNTYFVNGAVLLAMTVGVFVNAAESDSSEKKAASSIKVKTKAKKNTVEAPAVRLESVFVGDKEQPAISYFIPWQGIGTPDKLYWNVEEKHDKSLGLVDREIMLRSIHFYEEMNLEAPRASK